ncbi:hypothetical protein IWW47_000328 [Coemansia sp. RSA 2052]|nr:hypothetical protein IWW47_000328 [Coemansia sp. RSA 2052]
MHRGRLAYVVNEPLLTSVVAIVRPISNTTVPTAAVMTMQQVSPYAAPRRHNGSRDSVDSSLPLYEPPPPSLHNSSINNYSIREEREEEDEEEEEEEEEIEIEDFSFSDQPTDALMIPNGATATASHSICSPPPYWEIAQQTEYGRAHTRRAAAAAATAIFGAVPQGSLLSRRSSHMIQVSSNSGGVALTRSTTVVVPDSITSDRQQQRHKRQRSESLAGGGLARTFTQSMPALPCLLQDEQAVAAAIEDSRRHAVATASTSNNEHVIRFVQQSVASVTTGNNTAEEQSTTARASSNSGTTTSSAHFRRQVATRVRMARLSAKTNPEYGSSGGGGKKHSGWLWRLLNM